MVTAPIPDEAVEAAKRDLRAACCVHDNNCPDDHAIYWTDRTVDHTVTHVEGDVDEIARVAVNAAAPILRADERRRVLEELDVALLDQERFDAWIDRSDLAMPCSIADIVQAYVRDVLGGQEAESV